MPTNTTSAYELHEAESRTQLQRSAETAKLVQRHRGDVEEVIKIEAEAGRMEKRISAFDADESFRQRVTDDRTTWQRKKVFFAAALLYTGGEFFASGDVAEWLAHQFSPLFDIQTEETPVWLRRAAGVGFVGIMLGVTLLLKFVTACAIAKFQAARMQSQIGQRSHFWKMTLGIWSNYAIKASYLGAVALLYVWLYGFAQERAALTASIKGDDQLEQLEIQPLKFENGSVSSARPLLAPNAETGAPSPDSKLALATAVIYVCLWALHALVLILPVDGFGRELEFAHFKRGAVERQVNSMRDRQGLVLRDILERIHSVEGEHRDILIRETQPVVHLVNKAVGRQAMDEPASGRDEEPPAVAAFQTPPPPSDPTPSGAPTAAEPQDAYEAIFGNRAA
jgi:hypothetical protein